MGSGLPDSERTSVGTIITAGRSSLYWYNGTWPSGRGLCFRTRPADRVELPDSRLLRHSSFAAASPYREVRAADEARPRHNLASHQSGPQQALVDGLDETLECFLGSAVRPGLPPRADSFGRRAAWWEFGFGGRRTPGD